MLRWRTCDRQLTRNAYVIRVAGPRVAATSSILSCCCCCCCSCISQLRHFFLSRLVIYLSPLFQLPADHLPPSEKMAAIFCFWLLKLWNSVTCNVFRFGCDWFKF